METQRAFFISQLERVKPVVTTFLSLQCVGYCYVFSSKWLGVHLLLFCRGMYGIRIKALLGRTALDAPTINVR